MSVVRDSFFALEQIMKKEQEILAFPLPSEENLEAGLSLESELEWCRNRGEQAVKDLLSRFSSEKGEISQEQRDVLRVLLLKRQEHRTLFMERLEKVSEKLKVVRKEKKALSGYRPGQHKDSRFVDKKG